VCCGLGVQLLNVYVVLLCSVTTLDVTHPWNTDHAPGNLILTGNHRHSHACLFRVVRRK